jgi:hypothetical protein
MTQFVTIKLRRNNAAQWTAVNPVLAEGELGLELDTRKFKVGDGATSWNSLQYWGGSGGAADFIDLGDVPVSYAGAGGQYVKVKHTADGLEFEPIEAADLPSGIDAAKIANGTVSNTEFQTLNGASATFTSAKDSKLANIEDNADVTDATNVNAAGAVMESDYSTAHSVLVQQSGSGSPVAVHLGNNTMLGKSGGGNIAALSASTVRSIINVEDGADVTDAANVGSVLNAASAKTTPVDADTIPLSDSAASGALKKLSWANLKATLKTYFDTLYLATGALTGYATQAWVAAQGYITNVVTALGYTPANKAGDTFTGNISAPNLSGTNTGDQTITLTGDVTGTGTGSFAATIANDAVTNAKLANMATATIKGRTTAGSGDPEDLTGTQATTLLDTFTSSLKGLAPASGGGTTNFLRADGTWAAPAGGGGVSDGDKGDITVSSSGTVWTVDTQAITYAKIQNVSTNNRLLGRATSGAGDIEEITIGSGLTLTGTTLSASGGGGGGADGTVLSPSQITAWQNNYNPSSWASTVGVLRINSNQFHFLSGLTATTDGHTVRIFNTGTFPIGLYNQNTDSTAANRFAFDDHDVIILPQNSVELYYDGTASRWSLAAGWTLNSESQYVSKYWNEAFTTAGDNHGATAALWPVSGGTANVSGTGGVTGARVGIVDLATGTGASGRAAFYASANTSMAYDDGTGKSYMEFKAEFRSPAALSDATNEYFIHAGFIDSVIADSADGAFLKYTHGINSGQWQFLTADTSTRTTGNSTVALAVNTWYCLRVVMYPNGTAEFYIDGVSLGRNTANLPSNGRDFSFGIVLRKNAGTTARNMLVDGVGYTVVKYRK